MHLLCPHCQNAIELVSLPDSGEVLCASCGSTFRIEDSGSTTQSGTLGPGRRHLGRFELIGEVGIGAFGTVYKAHDRQLDRAVALKVPRAGNLPDGQELDRFLREARSAAQLRHPAIVPVYEAGLQDGTPYLVSDFVEGVTLADRLTAGPMPVPEVASLIATVAEALDHAHRHGVVHRDVKPSNIMLRDDGKPVVTDFGLAKRETGEITMTQDGQILGTPAYMSPEQARGDGHRVDGRSDIYSLGVILYRLLTGELPFRGNTRMLLHQVLNEEPRPPRKLNDHIPRDLETICLKCLEKDPVGRYAVASDLAADLGRWLAGEPIAARPAGRLEKAWKWTRRNAVVAALCAVIALAIVVGVLGVAWQWRRAEANFHDAEAQRRIAEANYEDVKAQRRIAEANYEDAKAQRKVAEARTAEARAKARELEHQGYVSLLALGQREAQANHIQLSDRLLDRTPPALRGWEWRYCNRANHRELSTLRRTTDPYYIKEAAPSPDGRRLACFAGKVAWVCDFLGNERASMKGHAEEIASIAWSPDGKTVATGGRDRVIRLWDAQTGAERGSLGGHGIWVTTLCFSPDGTRLLSGAGAFPLTPGRRDEVKLWDVAGRREIRSLMSADGGGIEAVAYSPDGKRVAAGHPRDVHVWDADTGEQVGLFAPSPAQGTMTGVAFAPDGRAIAAGSSAGGISLWNVQTGALVHGLSGHDGPVRVQFSPDGRWLATAGTEGVVRLWDPRSGREHATLRGHHGGSIRPEFDPSGARLITSSQDGSIRIWDATVETDPPVLVGHNGWANAVSFHPDGRTVATGGWGGILIWDAAGGRRIGRIDPVHRGGPRSTTYSPDGRRIAAVGLGPLVHVWETSTGREVQALDTRAPGVSAVVFSPDGSTLITGDDDGFVCSWDLATSRESTRFRAHDERIVHLSLSPDGRKVVSASVGDVVKAWDLGKGQELSAIRSARSHGEPNGPIAVFDAAGKRLAVLRGDHSIGIIDAEEGWVLRTLPGHSAEVNAIAFSPDGRRLASGGEDQTIRLWDPERGEEVLILRGHRGAISSLDWSRDGRFLASASTDGTGRIWDAGPSTTPYNPPDLEPRPVDRSYVAEATGDGKGGIGRVAYAPDGRTIALGCTGGDVQLWDTASKSVRAVLRGHSAPAIALAFSPDGTTLATGSGDWKKGTDPAVIKLWDARTGTLLADLKGHGGPIWSLAFSPDGTTLASGSADGLVKLWDPARRADRATLDAGTGAWVRGLAFTPDGKALASAHFTAVRLWDLDTLKTVRRWDCHSEEITAIAIRPDGRMLATASRDQTAALWDLASSRKLATIDGNKGWVNDIAFSPGGKSLVLGVQDGAVKLWDVAEGRLHSTGHNPDGALCVAFSPDKKTVASAQANLVLWRFAD